MQSLFTVLAKLLGVLLTYWGLTTLAAAFLVADAPHLPAFNLASAALAFVFAFVLTLRTGWLAGLIGIHEEARTSRDRFEPRAALRTGIILIGVYVFLVRLAIVLNFVYLHLSPGRVEGIVQPLVRALLECIPLLLALVLVFRADRLAEIILGAQGEAQSDGPVASRR